MRISLRNLCIALLLLVGLWPLHAHAHGFDPGVLVIEELAYGGDFTHRFRLTQPVDARGPGVHVQVQFPAGCTVNEAAHMLRCKPSAFAEPMSFRGLVSPSGNARMIVSLRKQDGSLREYLSSDESSFFLESLSPNTKEENSFWSWVSLGARHLLSGPDHLAFLFGLLSLTQERIRLFFAVTAFSLGHALSLGLATAGLISLPMEPTEALIAVSVVLVAVEALRPSSQTLARRAPALVALLFGLVHGIGFASALGERGLSGWALVHALFSFHVGIEVTQILLVIVVTAAWWKTRQIAEAAALQAQRIALYLIGSWGMAWTLERVALILGL